MKARLVMDYSMVIGTPDEGLRIVKGMIETVIEAEMSTHLMIAMTDGKVLEDDTDLRELIIGDMDDCGIDDILQLDLKLKGALPANCSECEECEACEQRD